MSNDRTISVLQYQLPMAAWCVFIFIASSIPSNNIPVLGGFVDKIVHANVFAMLCWLTHVALFHQPQKMLRKYSLMLALFFTFLYGISDEYHQSFTPGRYSDPLDLLADVAGGIIYVLVNLKFKFYRDE